MITKTYKIMTNGVEYRVLCITEYQFGAFLLGQRITFEDFVAAI